MKYIFITTFAFAYFYAKSQIPGCTDPQANNYNALATVNDGSCAYGNTSLSPAVIHNFPAELPETSGMLWYNGTIWSHNDSGGEPVIYAVDSATGALQRTVTLQNATAVDWEDITQGNGFVFVGDIGNNAGNRTDLTVWKVSWDSIAAAVNDSVFAYPIRYVYGDQIGQVGTNSSHNFDCEALAFWNDSLHLFTKHISNGYTKHYVLPADTGNYIIYPVDSLLVNGQITAADFSADSVLVLIGYEPPLYGPFAWMCWDFQGNALFSGNKRRFNLGSVFSMGQQEGFTFTGLRKGLISSEEVSQLSIAARYYAVDFSGFFSQLLGWETPEKEAQPWVDSVLGNWILHIPQEDGTRVQILNLQGKTVYRKSVKNTQTLTIPHGEWPAGIYVLSLTTGSENWILKIQKP